MRSRNKLGQPSALIRDHLCLLTDLFILKVRHVHESRQRDPQPKFSRYIGQRITCRLAGQGRAPRQTGVHLDDVVLKSIDTYRLQQDLENMTLCF